MSDPIAAIESEQAVIGALLFAPDGGDDLRERLRPHHFSEHAHGDMWRELCAPGADGAIVSRQLETHAGFVGLGGASYVANLIDHATLHPASLDAHADAILDAAQRRAIAELTGDINRRCLTPGLGEALAAEAERGLAEIARDAGTAPAAAPIGFSAVENLEAALDGKFRGISTGLACLDRITGGIKRDDVWIFGGRSSMGKSIIGLTLARAVAEGGRGVLAFSLEMSARECQARLIADIAHSPDRQWNVRYGDVLRGEMMVSCRDYARAAARQLASLPVMVNDRGGLTIDDIGAQALRQVRAWERAGIEPGLILIDHLGLVRPIRQTDSKAADTAATVDQLKGLAKRIGCPIVALAQVNRGPESRSDKRPTMGDLNWSGSIEQIADLVCLLYRQAYYDQRGGETGNRGEAAARANDLELLVQKNRAGQIGVYHAWIDPSANAIRDVPDTPPTWDFEDNPP